VLELQLERDLEHGSDEYFEVISGKTASLIRTSARLGAMTAGAGEEAIEVISEWAFEMGLVFQITDDVLDLVADEQYLGKPAGSDIREGVYTLPVLYALETPAGREIRNLLEGGRHPSEDAVAQVIRLTAASGAIDRVLDEATERLRRAEKATSRLPESDLTAVLRNLDRFLLDRVEAVRF
jgi:heptaprenyl diphosphate synthase